MLEESSDPGTNERCDLVIQCGCLGLFCLSLFHVNEMLLKFDSAKTGVMFQLPVLLLLLPGTAQKRLPRIV